MAVPAQHRVGGEDQQQVPGDERESADANHRTYAWVLAARRSLAVDRRRFNDDETEDGYHEESERRGIRSDCEQHPIAHRGDSFCRADRREVVRSTSRRNAFTANASLSVSGPSPPV